MDTLRSRIEEDLQGVIEGKVRCDDTFLQMYASDASIYETRPIAVVMPSNTNDVVQCVQYAAENQIPIIPRGAASNVIGGCVGSGIVLDFSNSMRRTLSVDRESVTVEPGVVLAELNKDLNSHGRRFGPDPATRRVSTIGGILALNASGSRWLQYGTPRDTVLQLEVVLANGQVATIDSARHQSTNPQPSSVSHLESKVQSIVNRYDGALQEKRPKTKINQAGYNLFDVIQNGKVDLTRLLVGSEGTLAIVTKAKLLSETLARHRGVLLLSFHELETAAKAAVEIAKMGVVACDLIDRRLLKLACETNPEFQRLLPADAESVLLVEIEAEEHSLLQERLAHLKNRILNRRKLAFDIRGTTQPAERDLYWRLTRRIIPTLYRLRGNKRALTFVEDIAVDPTQLPSFMKLLHMTLNEFEVTASIFSHTPQGQINVRPFLDLSDGKDRRKMQQLSEALFERVIEFGGTISGARGDGLSRSWFLKRQYGQLYQAFSAVKRTFDPQNIFNPGKVIASDDQRVAQNVRSVQVRVPKPIEGDEVASPNQLPILETQLDWDADDLAFASRNCNGCARCRSNLETERMCPVFRLSPHEEATPRAKANLMRAIVTGQLPADTVASDQFKEVVDLCFNCHQCRLDCPASVDVPKLMVEAKANYYATNGLKLSDWLLTRIDWLYEVASKMPRVANFIIRSPLARTLLERFFGIASGRKLPSFANQSFGRWATQNKLRQTSKQQSRKICYFVDAYVAWNDTELGRALVSVLKHNGIDVVIPNGQGISGMSLISDGAIKPARKLASRNVEILAEYVRQGYQIVTTEPSAALALRHEYLNLLDDNDAKLVAENTLDACSLLLKLHQAGDLELDFIPTSVHVGYHLPCHQRVFTDDPPAVKLLKLIPGLHVEWIEKGCSGMAGTWGLKSKNYIRSLKIGFGLINAVRDSAIIAGTTECSTCKIQMEQGTVKPTIHPIKILAKAYGLMPEMDDLFHRRSEELVTS